ncbi:hypothetical protein WT0BACILLUS_00662 [Bacillus altitudinis]|nr:hypothetical protein WT0BACILLUS_00662 [Bacillus altitudinis]
MDRLIPFTLHSQTESLTIFSYWFKVGKRSLIECVIFNSPPKIQIVIPIIQVLSKKVKGESYYNTTFKTHVIHML